MGRHEGSGSYRMTDAATGARDDATRIRGWWLPAATGALLWLSAIAVFGRVRSSLVDIGLFGAEVPEPSPGKAVDFLLRETAARFLWNGAELVLIAALCIGILATLYWVTSALRRHAKERWTPVALVGLITVVLSAGVFLGLSRQGGPEDFTFTFDSISTQIAAIDGRIRRAHEANLGDKDRDFFVKRCFAEGASSNRCAGLGLTEHLTALSNALTIVFLVLLMLAFVVTLAEPVSRGSSRLVQLAARQQRLRELLLVGAALLVIGVVEIYLLWSWHTIHFAPAQEQLAKSAAKAITISFGAFFSALLLALYIPATLVVTSEARRTILFGLPAGTSRSPERLYDAMKKNGFAASSMDHLGDLAAALGPIAAAFLGGPIGQILGVL